MGDHDGKGVAGTYWQRCRASVRVFSVLAALLLPGLIPHWGAEAFAGRTVRVGVYANEPKLVLTDNGKLSGIFGDLLSLMASREDWTLQPVKCDWSDCLQLLRNGKIDLLPDVAYNSARAKAFAFHHEPVLSSWSQVYARRGLNVESMLDLNGRRIALLQNSIQVKLVRSLLASYGVQVTIVPVKSYTDGFAAVRDGRADAVVTNHQFGDYHAARYGLLPTPITFQPAQLFFASTAGRNAVLLKTIDHYLTQWKSDPQSEYYKVLRRWGAESIKPLVPDYVWWIIGGLVMLLVPALSGAALMRMRMRTSTRELAASEERLSLILSSVGALIYIKSPDHRYHYANRGLCEFLGSDYERIVGETDARFFSAEVVARMRESDYRVLEFGHRVEEELSLQSPDGDEHSFLSIKLPLRRADGEIYAICGIATDITERKRYQEEIHQLAFYDALTGLPNRRLLLERLQQSLSRRHAAQGALLYFDLDNFKLLNDTLGHDMGDQLLVRVAERLRSHLRSEDTLARIGGDEFIAMLEFGDESPERVAVLAQQTAEKLLQLLSQPFDLEGRPHETGASVGVALFTDRQSTLEELLKRADMAMYEAKAAGRNTVRFFNREMQRQLNERTALEADLRQAMSSHQFELYYQPQVGGDGRLLGVEALIRWHHPTRGTVSPITFIPLAESTGLIRPLGDWILETACIQLVKWAADPATADLTIAVNISPRQLHHSDFIPGLQRVLDRTGANPSRLMLELTESLLVEDSQDSIDKITRIRQWGVCFSLDDFGTGYSSLSYLKRLPLDHIKIDQSFVRDILTNANDASIVRSMIALARSMELTVIAEGVETEAQREALLALGCDQFQGYLIGRPMPLAKLTEAMLSSAPD